MRRLIVSNFVTVDGFYESKDKTFNAFFDYYHKDYEGGDHFDHYNAELLRAADTLTRLRLRPTSCMVSESAPIRMAPVGGNKKDAV